MNDRARRPRQPFLTKDGKPRVEPMLSVNGPVHHRSGELLVNLTHPAFAEARRDPFAAARIVAQALDGIEFSVDDVDAKQGVESGWLRVKSVPPAGDRTISTVAMLDRLREAFGTGESAGDAVRPNAVFLIGAFTADPMRFGSVFGADPMRFGSAYGDPMRFGNSSTARPALAPSPTFCPTKSHGPGAPVTVAILDTGSPVNGAAPLDGDVDFDCLPQPIRERPDDNSDAFLDIAAGHTTFIRTIIQRGCPDAQIMIEGVIHNDGDGDEADIANALQRVFDSPTDKATLILNLSFSGYYEQDEPPPLIAYWIARLIAAGAVVVAAAGNDGDCRPKFPAALPGVIAVAAMGSCGPASFSNHGSWVDACAPGEDLVSEFFTYDGAFEPLIVDSVPDVDEFTGWAMWSGTSFATPIVVAALAELIVAHGGTARQAVDRLIGRPGLLRVPDYGVVVNRIF